MKFEERTRKYTKNYTNEHICKQIRENCTAFTGIILISLFGCFLILLSFVRTYRDIHTEYPIPFNDFSSTMDDTCYSVTITKMPQEVCAPYYDLAVGSDHILAAHINMHEIRGQDEPVTLRGKIKRIRVSEEDAWEIVKEYYQRIGYYDSLKDEKYAFYYLDCTKLSLWDELRDNHPLGLVFGLTILIVIGIGIHEYGSLYMIKHIRPACSGRRYQAREIDELANHPDTIWLNNIEVFVTPNSLIGLNHGITVVDYSDIAGIKVKEKTHGYLLIIKTKKHRKMVLTETANQDNYNSLITILDERCGTVEYII